MSIFNSQTKDGEKYIDLFMVDGINSIPKDTPVRITILNEGRLQIQQRFSKNAPFYLAFSQITNAGIVTEKEIVEKSKSVVGRAVAGGLILGPLGAVVGGMTGVGNKKRQKISVYYVLNYVSGQSGVPAVLSFKLAGTIPTLYNKFTDELLRLAGIKKRQNEVSQNL